METVIIPQRTPSYRPPIQLCHRKFKTHRKLITTIAIRRVEMAMICGRVDGIRTAVVGCRAVAWDQSYRRIIRVRYQIPTESTIIMTRARQITRQWQKSGRQCIRRTHRIEAVPMRMSISERTCLSLISNPFILFIFFLNRDICKDLSVKVVPIDKLDPSVSEFERHYKKVCFMYMFFLLERAIST
jgi:hypothetical protein